MSAEGMTFDNYYVQPVCSPTRASLLTGRYSIHTGAQHLLWGTYEPSCLPVSFPMMPRAFKALNYSTHMVGKWHLGHVNDTCAPWGRGFDSFIGFLTGNEGYYYKSYDFSQSTTPGTCEGCTKAYDGNYSTEVYSARVQSLLRAWKPGKPPLFIYVGWQAVHEPMDAPERHVARFRHIGDESRRLYAAMLASLDEGLGNISDTITTQKLTNETVTVMSNDNGGMSGTYGLGCCNCGTSCGGLNYPYRGWKDSMWEGGFRGIGFVHAPDRLPANVTYEPLIWVGDWYTTLLSAARASDSPAQHAAAEKSLASLLATGPIDSADQWAALVAGGVGTSAPPREELVLAGIDIDKQGAAIRVGP